MNYRITLQRLFNKDNIYYVRSGDWEWETGQYSNQAEETEYIRIKS
ncbi:MAG: hypothetical protein JXM70_10375 [Pirellulales bacterium]|nr:hypothetical protein [Pirellulales bacterium]